MNRRKTKIVISFFIILIVSLVAILYKKNDTCDGCGGCDYIKFADIVKVNKIVWKRDSINYIHMKSIIDSNLTYEMDSWDLSFRIGKDFTVKEVKDTLNRYSITGDRIMNGTCAPYIIDKMILEQK